MTEQADIAPAQTPLLTHEIDGEMQLETAIVDAFRELGVDVDEREPLYELAPPEPLKRLLNRSETPVTVSTVVWGHVAVIKPERIRIFEAPESDEA